MLQTRILRPKLRFVTETRLAAELASLKPRVLFTYSPQAATAAAEATRTIPIIVGPPAVRP